MNAVMRSPSESVNRSCAPGAFFAQDQPGPGRPAAHLDQSGGLGDPGAVADAAVGLDGRIPAVVAVEDLDGVAHAGVDGVAEGESHPGVTAGGGERVGGAGGIRSHQICCPAGSSGFGRYAAGNCFSACSNTVRWSAAVLLPALARLSSPDNASPPAISGRSRNASSQ